MKVLFISQYYLPQPLANAEVIGGLVTSLGDEGHEVTVVSPVAGATPSRNVRHRRALGYFAADRRSIVGRLAEYGLFSIGSLWSGLRAPTPDVVVVTSPPLTLAIIGAAVARRHRRPLVYNVQDLYPEVADAIGGTPSLLRTVLRAVARWVYRTSAAVVVIDPAFEAVIRASAPDAVVRSVRNGIDRAPFLDATRDEEYLRSIGVPADRPVLMYAGNVGRSQDLEPVVAAADAAGATLVIHGGGAALEELRSSTDGESCVRFSGYVGRERLGSVFASADLHVVPLKPGVAWASVPSKLLSIFSAGRPVVLAAEADSPAADVLREADGGWLVPPADPVALRSAIALALDDTNERARRAGSAGRWAEQQAGQERMAREWAAVLDEVVAGPVSRKGPTAP